MKPQTAVGSNHYITLIAFILSLECGLPTPGVSQWRQTQGPSAGIVRMIRVIDSYVFAAMDGLANSRMLYRSSDDGVTWTPTMTGLTNRSANALVNSGSTLFVGTDSGIFRSSDLGTTWSAMNATLIGVGGDTQQNVTALAAIGSYLIAGTSSGGGGGGIFFSQDSGQHWTRTSTVNDAINTLIVHGSALYAGSRFSGVTVSSDSGRTWNPRGLFRNSVYEIVFVGSTIIVAASPGFYPPFIARSNDNGSTWTSLDSGSVQTEASTIVALGSTLFAGTPTGVWKSTDTGGHWTSANAGLMNKSVNALATREGKLFAGAYYAGVFHSLDSSRTWQPSVSGLTSADAELLAMDGPTLFAAIPHAGLTRSNDRGASWSFVQAGQPANYSVDAMFVNGGNLFISAEDSIFRSTDHGSTWIPASFGLRRSQYKSIIALGDVLLTGGRGNDTNNVYRSFDNGNSWSAAAHGLPAFPNSFLAFDIRSMTVLSTSIFALVNDTVFSSVDSGAHWARTAGTLPAHADAQALMVSGADLYVTTQNAGLYRSTDSGRSWQLASMGLPNDIQITAIYSVDSILLLAARQDVYFSTDRGDTWNSANWGGGSNGSAFDYVTCFGSDGSTIYAGTSASSVWQRDLSELRGHNSVKNEHARVYTIRSYPNPFSSSTEISFTTEARGHVDVSIVNGIGAEVSHLYSGILEAGEHSYRWGRDNTAQLPDGVYECVVRMDGRAYILPIVLIR